MFTFLLPLAGYFFGSVSTAILICKVLGLPDPRSVGSNNPGATNVLRIGGKKAAALTLIGDVLKGLLPVLLAKFLTNNPQIVAATAVAAFLGHLYPVFFGFKGGKGVATGIGAIFGLSWVSGLLLSATWLATSLTFRISSLAALIAFTLAPLYLWTVTGSIAFVIAVSIITALLIWRHRTNVQRIFNGSEPKIGQKNSDA